MVIVYYVSLCTYIYKIWLKFFASLHFFVRPSVNFNFWKEGTVFQYEKITQVFVVMRKRERLQIIERRFFITKTVKKYVN